MARGSASRRRPHARTTAVVSALGVTVLTVGVIALSMVAYQHAHPPASERTLAPVPTFELSAPRSPSPVPTPTLAQSPGSVERFLAVGSSAMWRGTAGACGVEASVIERSTDDGASWHDVTPTYRNVQQLRSLTSFAGANAAAIVDATGSCVATAMRTFTDGEFWEPSETTFATASYISSQDVVLRGEAVAAPCATPWGLRVGGVAAIICDGAAYLREASAWTTIAPRVTALAVDDSGVVAGRITADCPGLQLTRYDGEASSELACLRAVDATAPLAIDLDDSDIVIWSGTEITRTAR